MNIDVSGLAGKRLLITGGAGMIGSTLAHDAVALGAEVTIADSMSPLYGGNPFNLEGLRGRVEFVRADLREFAVVEQLVQDKDVIFCLAGQVSHIMADGDPLEDLDANVKINVAILEACRRLNSRARLIFSSSRMIYGRAQVCPVDESHQPLPINIYGVHKLAAERHFEFYARRYGLDSTVLRLPNAYGPRQQMRKGEYGILNWFVRLALEGKPITIYGRGHQRRDYVYIDDLARAFLLAAASRSAGFRLYNIGTGIGSSILEVAQAVALLIPGTELQTEPWPADRFVDTSDYWADSSLARRELGWRAETSLDQGLRQTIAYYSANAVAYGIGKRAFPETQRASEPA